MVHVSKVIEVHIYIQHIVYATCYHSRLSLTISLLTVLGSILDMLYPWHKLYTRVRCSLNDIS